MSAPTGPAAALLAKRRPTTRVKIYPDPLGEPLWVEITRLSTLDHAAAFGLAQAMAGMVGDTAPTPTVSDMIDGLERYRRIAQLSVTGLCTDGWAGEVHPIRLVLNADEAATVPEGIEAIMLTDLLSQTDVQQVALAASHLAGGAEAQRAVLPSFR